MDSPVQAGGAVDRFGPIRWFDWALAERRDGSFLPHIKVPGAVYFVTARLWDSVPADVYKHLAEVRERFMRVNPPPHDEKQRERLKWLYYGSLERCLDQGIGSCVLNNPTCRGILENIMLRFDGDRYQIDEYVIMPTHFHVLTRIAAGTRRAGHCRSWKSLSAVQINHTTERSGRLWQPDNFDHVIRNAEQLEKCREYIRNNPKNQRAGEFTQARGKGW